MKPEEIVAQIQKDMGVMAQANKEMQEQLKEDISGAGADAKNALAKAEELATVLAQKAQSIIDLEQKLADGVQSGTDAVETLGQIVIKSDAFKQFAAGNSQKMRIEANTIIGQEGSPPANSDTIVAPNRLPGIVPGAFRLLKVRDVLPRGNTSSNSIEFTRELAWTNNAAETNEGITKPQSSLTFELKNVPVQTVAHWIKASKQVLEDAPMLQSYIDNRMRYGVEYRIDSQLVNGNGTNPNLSGILDTGNFTAFTPTPGENGLDSINRAIYAVYASEYAPSAILMNPADWGAIERTKVGTGDASYVVGNPTGILGPQLWGLPVVVSNAVPAGTFIVGAMEVAYQVFTRSNTVVEMFEQDDTNVQKNLITIRGEARLAMATYLPAAVRAGLLVDPGT